MAPLGIGTSRLAVEKEEEQEEKKEEVEKEASASRNEVPKSPQSGRERSIIAKVRAPLSYLFRRSHEGNSDL